MKFKKDLRIDRAFQPSCVRRSQYYFQTFGVISLWIGSTTLMLAQTNQPGASAVPDTTAGTNLITELPPMVITASPSPNSLFDLATPVTVLAEEQLRERLATTLGETLASEPGIQSTYFGPNASRPVIRGLEGSHIRVLQNGVGNMDVSELSPDHAVAQDPLTIKRIEVVRGPAALLYGPTAVGGVVNIIDNRIPDTDVPRPVTGQLEGRFTSSNKGRGFGGVIEGGYRGLNYHMDGFIRENDELDIPGLARSRRLRQLDPRPLNEEPRDTLPNSQGQADGGAGGLSYVWDKGYAGGSFAGFESDYGTVAEEEVTIRMTQRRWDLAGAFYEPIDFLKSVRWKFGASDYEHTEFEGTEAGTVFKEDGLNGRLEALHRSLGRVEGSFGYEARRDELSVQGEEGFLPPTDSLVNSLFVFEEIKWDKVRLQFGGRYDRTRAEADEFTTGWTGVTHPAGSRDFNNGSGSAGVVYDFADDFSTSLNFSYTERAPIHQELFGNGPHLATGQFVIGDPTLSTERCYGLDYTIRRETGKITGSSTFFFTHFDNFVSLEPTGTSVPNPEDPSEALPVFRYSGVPANFVGVEASVMFHFLEEGEHRLHLELKTDYTHATNTDTDEPLPRIPPWRYGADLVYDWKDRFTATVSVLRANSQHRTIMDELPTDGYTMLNLGVTYRFGTGPVDWDLLVRGTNLLDEEARLHTSFLKDIAPLPGRGAVVALRLSF